MFLSRLGKLAAASVITLVTVSSVSAQSVEQVVRSELGHNFGLFGPLAFDAEDVFVRSNTVSPQNIYLFLHPIPTSILTETSKSHIAFRTVKVNLSTRT